MNKTQLSSFEIPDTIFDEIERSCRVHLSKAERKTLLVLIGGQVELCRMFTDAPRPSEISKYLDRLERRLAAAHEAVADLTARVDKTAEMADKWLRRVLSREMQLNQQRETLNETLDAVRGASRIFRSDYVRKGPPRKEIKRMMIWAYADFFEALGGKPSASYKGFKERRDSRFLRFLHIIERHLPKDVIEDFRRGLDEMAKRVLVQRKKSRVTNEVTLPDILPFL